VARFVEKPDLATAERYLAEGGYFWNAGMFVLKASVWMAALERFRPDIAAACRAAWAAAQHRRALRAPGQGRVRRRAGESVDYAVMERCPGSGIDIRMVRWTPAGTTWAPGKPSGRWPKDAARQRQRGRRHRQATAATRWCTPPAAWSAWWAWTTWSWSKPPTPCWWPTASAART
jgi:hypothetical protein